MNKRVEGVYPVVDEALRVVDQLRDQGYSPDDITLVANEDVRRDLSTNVDADVETRDDETNGSNGDDDSFWESVKDAFTFEDSDDTDPNYDSENDPLYEHREAISQGNVVVLVNEDVNINDTMDQTDPTSTSTHPETPTRDAQGSPDTPNPENPDTVTPDSPNPDPGTPNPGAPDPTNPEPGVPDPTNPEPGVPEPEKPNPNNPDPTKDDDDDEERPNNP